MRWTELRWWRSHPILTAAVSGGLVGLVYTLAIEIGGVFHKNSKAAILMLLPGSAIDTGVNQGTAVQSAFILFIEFAGNVLGYTLLFTVPVATVVAIRRVFRGRTGGAGE